MNGSISAIGLTVTVAFAAPAFATEEAQPLTRADCEQAGMAWDANANVCGSDKVVESKKEKKKKKGKKRKKDQSRLKEEPPPADSP